MKRIFVAMLLCGLQLGCFAGAVAQKTLFYMQETAASVHSFEQHKDKIDILVPTWYSVNGHGLVTGEPDTRILSEAKDAHVEVIPIVVLFDKQQLHELFSDVKAQDEMNRALVRECKQHGYAGIQFDLEHVLWVERDGLSALIKRSAAALHAEGLQVQIATVPNAPGYAGSLPYVKWMFEEWRGGYDLKALAESVDLIRLMTYDQHSRYTAPGPVDGWQWTVENLDYALKDVPREKLSLGVALYGYHWFAGDPGLNKPEQHPNPTAESISFTNAEFLRTSFNAKLQWDDDDHTPWFYFNRDNTREWIFYTDKRAFMDRYELAKQRGLQGVCAWVLGEEDPAIWDAIPAKR
ncbi:MAG TPA: glycosyl hydrolase family 18 protein [Candidatus Aquilonibacter sp.]|nr:glycosyl hydrolase family 18 protein [Candidatus Aquilonibacter sp.]